MLFKEIKVLSLVLLQLFVIGKACAIEPHSFDVGGFDFTPQIKAKQSYNDNYLYRDDDELESWITILNPQFSFSQTRNLDLYQFNVDLKNINYWENSDDSFTNVSISGLSALDLGTRHKLNLQGSYLLGHEERGKGWSIGFADNLKEPTPYDELKAKLVYTYGATTAQANLALSYRYSQIDWDSLYIDDLNIDPRDTDIDFTAERNHDIHEFGSTFYYKTGAFTKFTFNLTWGEVTYDERPPYGEPSKDSENTAAFLGFEWQGSAMTTGYAKVGYSNKNFDTKFRDDTDGFRWKVGVIWKPLTYSNFDFSTAKRVEESKGQGSYIENTNYNLAWHHQWLERIATKVAISFSDDDYGDTNREDENTFYSATVYYSMWRNLDFSATFKNAERESNIKAVEYTGNIFEIGVTASF